MTEVQPGQPLDNAERLAQEVDDLMAMLYMLRTRGVLRDINGSAIGEKMQKVYKFAELS